MKIIIQIGKTKMRFKYKHLIRLKRRAALHEFLDEVLNKERIRVNSTKQLIIPADKE